MIIEKKKKEKRKGGKKKKRKNAGFDVLPFFVDEEKSRRSEPYTALQVGCIPCPLNVYCLQDLPFPQMLLTAHHSR